MPLHNSIAISLHAYMALPSHSSLTIALQFYRHSITQAHQYFIAYFHDHSITYVVPSPFHCIVPSPFYYIDPFYYHDHSISSSFHTFVVIPSRLHHTYPSSFHLSSLYRHSITLRHHLIAIPSAPRSDGSAGQRRGGARSAARRPHDRDNSLPEVGR